MLKMNCFLCKSEALVCVNTKEYQYLPVLFMLVLKLYIYIK